MKKIHSTLDIKPDMILRVYKKGFGYSRLVVADVNDYFISAIGNKEIIRALKEGDRLDAYLWHDNESSYEFPLRVVGKIIRDFNMILFRHTDRIKWTKERKCLTARINLPFRFYLLEVDDLKKKPLSREITFLEGIVKSLSDREAAVQYGGDLKQQSFIKGHVIVDKKRKVVDESAGDIDIIGKVDGRVKSGGKELYRIVFTGMHGREREKIQDFIYNVYRE